MSTRTTALAIAGGALALTAFVAAPAFAATTAPAAAKVATHEDHGRDPARSIDSSSPRDAAGTHDRSSKDASSKDASKDASSKDASSKDTSSTDRALAGPSSVDRPGRDG
jgi:hypothetical protein